MLLVLPLLSYVLIAAALWRRSGSQDPRPAVLEAAVVCGVVLTVITEILGALHTLTLGGLAIGWSITTFAAVVFAYRCGLTAWRPTRPAWSHRKLVDLVLLLPVLGIVVVTGLLAAVSYPNSWDGMTYHLARVAHWIQNLSLDHYPTAIGRQLFSPPWAEFGMLHLLLLGEERQVNLVQWLSMVGSVLGVSLIARQLGAGSRGQLLAALFAATLPMGILQSTSTQNQYSTALWLVSLTSGLLKLRTGTSRGFHAFEVGASLGLAALTKTTTPLFAGPLLLLLVPRRPFVPLRLLRESLVIGCLALALTAPHFLRNATAFGSPLTPTIPRADGGTELTLGLTNAAFSVPTLVFNLSRNLALHLTMPYGSVTREVRQALVQLHLWLGLDPADRRTSYLAHGVLSLPGSRTSELYTGNPLHLLVILGLLLAAPLWLRSWLLARYALALLLGALLFALLLKWQPLHSRLHLPLFVLWAPLIGLTLGRRAIVALLIALPLVAWSWTPLLEHSSRPLLGADSVLRQSRERQYFFNNSSLRGQYLAAARRIRQIGCTQVGLTLGGDDFEYPFWIVLSDLRRAGGRVEHVGTDYLIHGLASRRPPFDPCAVIAVGTARTGNYYLQSLTTWTLEHVGREVDLYLPA